ncbi:FkbM family methyltransferase [Butyrivibrio sp. WCE2006]|uniref:FkbM family methyltransferase n=1 Tax=Butyrivibrio sp. WCE2006 TaxID=1410611 RepID=UPI00067881A2|nr:FkbM family methyltransferase [Butyrivibrio sp. WCE2006]
MTYRTAEFLFWGQEKMRYNEITLNGVCTIYSKMQDDISKEIFIDRLAFSVGEGIQKATRKLILDNEYVRNIIQAAMKKDKVVIFGAGKIGQRIANLFPEISIECFIDNNPENGDLNGKKVNKASEYIENNLSKVYLVSSIKYGEEIERQLLEKGVSKNNILNIGKGFFTALRNQYFDLPFITWNKNEIFVDAGCFDGETSLLLHELIKEKLKKVYAFEPMVNNLELCKKRLDTIGADYRIISKGLWDKQTEVYFHISHGQYHITEKNIDSSFKILTTTIDDEIVLEDEVSFIKMDIEGSELHALKGAEKVIMKNKPKLAICVYHLHDDFYRIPEYILSLNLGYKLYMRHYGSNSSETVLYALP